jgi:NADH:ubiquinone oxidoreductase subunit
MTIATKIYTKLFGKLVGIDEFGNRYYKKKSSYSDKKSKRWVVYKGLAEPSKVPSSWHGWLHYTIDEPLQYEHAWQKPHTPNLTGTPNAYSPTDNEGKRKKTSCDYEAWSPNIESK